MPRQFEWDCDKMAEMARKATDELLARLISHHDFNMALPDPGIEEQLVASEPEPAPVVVPVPVPPPIIPARDDSEDVIREVRVLDIKRATCRYFKLPPIELVASRRTRTVTYPRHIAFYIAKTLTTRSLPEIGRHFGGRDHTTVLHGVRKIEGLMKTDWTVAYDVAGVEACLENVA